MKRRRRTDYSRRQYPPAAEGLGRRRFLARMGAASGLVLLAGIGRASALYAATGQNEGYWVRMPSTDEWREFYPGGADDPLYYEVFIEVVSSDVEGRLGGEEDAVLTGFDAALEGYPREDLLEETLREDIEDGLLVQLVDGLAGSGSWTPAGSSGEFTESDFVRLDLEVSTVLYGDDWATSGGCSCSSVRWRGRRRARR